MNVKCLMHTKLTKVFFPLFFLFFLTFSFTAKAVDGEKLFKQNCSACHRLDDKKLTGPGLKGVFDRVPQPAEEWLYKWIKNNEELRKSGDAYANKVYNDFGKVPMSSFAHLSDEELKAIIAVIKAGPPAAPAPVATAPGAEPAQAPKGNTMLYVLLGLTILFLILINVLSGVKRSLQTLVNEKDGLPAPAELGTWGEIKYWMAHNKGIVALGVIIGFLWISKIGWDALMGIGVYQGYQPEQPIAFSHQIHAGQNGINCVYCHSGAEKGKTAGIPSANVCMNCHKAVQEGKITGTKEIAKIYAALDYDPNTGKYGNNPKPIQWVKVHNLPDHVYFNHSQHTVAGKQECKTCHGAIDSMTVAKQHSPLTMGWCIECHRTTEVQTAGNGNGYYDYIHATYKDKFKGQPITVEKMGGLECAKCHY
ncbi:MAG: cytochrome c3 family protein [Bacteroidia bacterium]